VRTHWPSIYTHFKTSIGDLIDKHQISEDEVFGHIFLQWCPNIPLSDIKKSRKPTDGVLCDPHIDAKNLAWGVCPVLVYARKRQCCVLGGDALTRADPFAAFLSTHKFWLVLWEAGVGMELPAGVWFIYPSALFTHFNIHLGDIQSESIYAKPFSLLCCMQMNLTCL
jgi:hypothetical protein